MATKIGNWTLPLSVERLLRTSGGALMGVVATEFIPGLVGLIPPPYGVLAGPIVNFVFKELRLRHPNNKFVKMIPL